MANDRQDSNQITREYFDSLMIEMRHIDSEIPDTRIRLFGQQFSMPIATAALSHLNGTAPDGMALMAEGARGQTRYASQAWVKPRRSRRCVRRAQR